MIKDAMAAKVQSTNGFVIDGFPVNMEQAKLFVEKIQAPTKIIVFDIKDEVMKIRLKERDNFDDKPESIVKRIDTYTSQTKPVIKEYSKSVITVSFNQYKSN